MFSFSFFSIIGWDIGFNYHDIEWYALGGGVSSSQGHPWLGGALWGENLLVLWYIFLTYPKYLVELYLHWSPVAYWVFTNLGSSSFDILSFCISYCSWGSQGKNTEVVCHSLLQWTTFCQTSPPWPTHPGWPHMAWLSFIELEKAVVHVIRLTSFLWLWFQCVCPLMPSRNTYHITWVSLTLDVGYLFIAAPAKWSRCKEHIWVSSKEVDEPRTHYTEWSESER